MKLITNAGVEINLDYCRVLDVKPGDKVVYKMHVQQPPTPQQMEGIMMSLQQIFGSEIPVILVGPNEEFMIIRQEELQKAVEEQNKIIQGVDSGV